MAIIPISDFCNSHITYTTDSTSQIMEDAIALFMQVYNQHHSIEICIAELKRKGFSQLDTIKVLMEVSEISIVEADEMVHNSSAWSD